MTRLDQSPEIHTLAGKLGIVSGAPVDGILDYCRRRIDDWVAEVGGVMEIGALELLITQRLQMVFEEIHSDADFDRIKEQHARAKKDPVFATMQLNFDDIENPKYGLLVRRNVSDDAPDRFVAVIDCRGSKLARRFFTRWHEIAHRLTTHADEDNREPAYRSEHDPIERMMDEIAGQIGFYEPIFDPAFRQASEGNPLLTFPTVQSVIDSGFPAASFQATLFACARRLPTPVVYVEAALDYKKEVRRRIENKTLKLFPGDEPPPGELRAVLVVANQAALDESFTIPKNMRVPADSVIYCLFDAESPADGAGREDLGQWESKGKSLEGRAVSVEARKVPDRVIAILQPVEARRRTKRRQPKSMFLD